MNIDRKDVLWNYAATFLQTGAQALLLPLILRALPKEAVGIWTVFGAVIALVNLLDFGFNPAFTRSVAYVFSGVKTLKTNGFDTAAENSCPDYGLLKGLVAAMRFFYSRMAIILFAVLAGAGTPYIHAVLKTYTGNRAEVYGAWILLCSINIYAFYTLYYDALLQGRGFIKRAKQIAVAGQSVYLAAACLLILAGFGLAAVVGAQALSVIIRRVLSHRVFYTLDVKNSLRTAAASSKKDILKNVWPNAVKLGLTGIGGFLVSRSGTVVGSLYLPLETIASYGITVQMIGIIGGMAGVYYSTYYPKMIQYRVQNQKAGIKRIWIKNCLLLFAVYVFFGFCMILFGERALQLIGSKTALLPRSCIAAALVIALLETNHGIAGGILATKNEVPYFRASIVSGAAVLALLIVFCRFTLLGAWGLVLAPGLAQAAYNNWKWPLEVYRELKGSENEM